MSSFVKLFDTVTITPTSVDAFKVQMNDNFLLQQDKVLRADIIASHAGRLTRNHALYLPQKLRDCADSLVSPYNKPVLVHHNSHDDAVGRIVAAKYVDTSLSYARDSMTDSIIKQLCMSNLPFIKSVKLIDNLFDAGLLRDPNYPGLGYILATVEINDMEAAQKVLDKRYLTVSIGFSTNRAICSICDHDWVEDGGPCEHKPGKEYDEGFAYLITGDMLGEEISFVNNPADTLARVVTIHSGNIQDSVIVEESSQIYNVNANFYLTDSVGGTSMDKIQEAWDQVSKLIGANETKKEDKIKVIKDFLSQFEAQSHACISEASKKLDELEQNEPEPTLDESDEHYEAMIALGYELSLFDEDFEDAKLSTKQRKGLAKSTFCKPSERKYPVPDCSHARVAMAYAKKYNEAASVVACIRRKAKALGCPFNGKKDAFEEWEAELDVILADLQQRAQSQEPAAVQSPAQTTDDTKPTEQNSGCSECAVCEAKVEALRQELKDIYTDFDCSHQSHVEDVEKAKLRLAVALVSLEQLGGKKIEDIKAAELHFASLPLEELLKLTDSTREGLDFDAILAKVNDGMANVPSEPIVNPTLENVVVDPVTDDDRLNQYRDKYAKVLDSHGRDEADAYLYKLIRAGLVPDGFDPDKGGSA